MTTYVVFAFIAAFVCLVWYKRRVKVQRQQLIDCYVFPERLTQQLQKRYPHLSEQDCKTVIHALREYFHISLNARRQMVAMPSQVVDLAWHEFILFTRDYDYFCRKALGRFLHHTPAEAMKTPTQASEGIKHAWRLACQRERISPKAAHKLPLLFAIDAQLNIDDGFVYKLDCKGLKDNGYCASHIGCAGGGCSGDSGCGGGCGGD